MDAKTVNEIGEGLCRILRFQTTPVGITLFEKITDAPADFQVIDRRLVACAVIGIARFYERSVVISRENSRGICLGADASLGWGSMADGFAESNVGLFTETADGLKAILSNWMSFDDRYGALGAGPIDSLSVVPDVVQIWCTPVQLMELVYANGWYNGHDRLTMSTNGHGGSCYEALTVPIRTGEIRIAIVDMGDRKHGYARDDEMILAVPTSKLQGLYEGLKKIQRTRHSYPILYDFDDIPFPVPAPVLQRKYPGIY